jgi:hypothetical protein
MEYSKPEIAVLGDATRAIQGVGISPGDAPLDEHSVGDCEFGD